MTLTAEAVVRHIEHALAGPTDLGELAIANEAGRHLVSMRNWRWLRGAKALVGTVAGQEWIALPADCKRVDAIEQTNSLVGTFEFVPLQEFLNYKTSTVTTSPISYWGTVVWARDTYAVAGTEAPGAPSPRIEVYPTPTATNASAFTVYYDRGWVELTEDNQDVTIPPFLESLYLALCRAFAKGYEEEDTADVNTRLASLTRGPLYLTAMREDVSQQKDMGRLRGGLASTGVSLYRWSGATITGP